MTDQATRIDLLSLEDFQSTVRARLTEVDRILDKLQHELAGGDPPLGRFHDGEAAAARYTQLHAQHVARLVRLRTSLVAADEATAEIIRQYRTNEQRTAAGTDDIATRLVGVSIALNGSTSV